MQAQLAVTERKEVIPMKIISTFKQLEHTEALDQKIEAKSQKLKKFFDGNFDILLEIIETMKI